MALPASDRSKTDPLTALVQRPERPPASRPPADGRSSSPATRRPDPSTAARVDRARRGLAGRDV